MNERKNDDEEAVERCGAIAVFWPEDEACEVECMLPDGHVPADVHCDDILGEWTETDVQTAPRDWWRMGDTEP